jgi:hypothetical protein
MLLLLLTQRESESTMAASWSAPGAEEEEEEEAARLGPKTEWAVSRAILPQSTERNMPAERLLLSRRCSSHLSLSCLRMVSGDWDWLFSCEAPMHGAGAWIDDADDDADDDGKEKVDGYREVDEDEAAVFFNDAFIASAEPCSESLPPSVMPLLPLFLLLELEPWEEPFMLESVERLSSLAE